MKAFLVIINGKMILGKGDDVSKKLKDAYEMLPMMDAQGNLRFTGIAIGTLLNRGNDNIFELSERSPYFSAYVQLTSGIKLV